MAFEITSRHLLEPGSFEALSYDYRVKWSEGGLGWDYPGTYVRRNDGSGTAYWPQVTVYFDAKNADGADIRGRALVSMLEYPEKGCVVWNSQLQWERLMEPTPEVGE